MCCPKRRKVTAQALHGIWRKNDWRDEFSNVSPKQSVTAPTLRSAGAECATAGKELATGKARSPTVERRVRRTTGDDVEGERRGIFFAIYIQTLKTWSRSVDLNHKTSLKNSLRLGTQLTWALHISLYCDPDQPILFSWRYLFLEWYPFVWTNMHVFLFNWQSVANPEILKRGEGAKAMEMETVCWGQTQGVWGQVPQQGPCPWAEPR